MRREIIPVFIFLVVIRLQAQESEIDMLIKGQLRMTFPCVYFKNKSTDYAKMPYSVDSCFSYLADCRKDITSFVIWRDSSETEQLTNSRIKKLKADLNKYTPSRTITIEPMKEALKISSHTIEMGAGSAQTQYLLSLNSVFAFDISKTAASLNKKKWKRNHKLHPRIWCGRCWRRQFYYKNVFF